MPQPGRAVGSEPLGSYCAYALRYGILSECAGRLQSGRAVAHKQTPLGEQFVKKYKLKTHKGTVKRMKITATGLVMRQQAAKTKYRRKKRGEILHSLHRQVAVAAGDAKHVRRLLPYGGK